MSSKKRGEVQMFNKKFDLFGLLLVAVIFVLPACASTQKPVTPIISTPVVRTLSIQEIASLPTPMPVYLERTRVTVDPLIGWPAYPTLTPTATPTLEAQLRTPIVLQPACIYEFGGEEIMQVQIFSYNYDRKSNGEFEAIALVSWRYAENESKTGQIVIGMGNLDNLVLPLTPGNSEIRFTEDGRYIQLYLIGGLNPTPTQKICK